MESVYDEAVSNMVVSPSYRVLTGSEHQLNLLICTSCEPGLCFLPIKAVCCSRMFHFLSELALSNAECLSYFWRSTAKTQSSAAWYPDHLQGNAHSNSKHPLVQISKAVKPYSPGLKRGHLNSKAFCFRSRLFQAYVWMLCCNGVARPVL